MSAPHLPGGAGRKLTRRLGREPAWRLSLQFAAMAEHSLMRRLAHNVGLRRRAEILASDLLLPDSASCRRAVEFVASVSPDFLLNHGVRSFVFGAALGRRDRLPFDRELLFLACVMHDLGLTRTYDGPEDFELAGARAAREWLLEQGTPEPDADIVHEAIALHARIGRAARAGPEAALTHLGAGMDVIGVRAEDFRPEQVEKVTAQWPRHEFKSCFAELVRDQAGRKPNSNIAGHVGLGFVGRIAAAPFPS